MALRKVSLQLVIKVFYYDSWASCEAKPSRQKIKVFYSAPGAELLRKARLSPMEAETGSCRAMVAGFPLLK